MGIDIQGEWNNGGRNIKLNQVKFIDMDPLNRDYGFSILAQVSKEALLSLVGWLKIDPKVTYTK